MVKKVLNPLKASLFRWVKVKKINKVLKFHQQKMSINNKHLTIMHKTSLLPTISKTYKYHHKWTRKKKVSSNQVSIWRHLWWSMFKTICLRTKRWWMWHLWLAQLGLRFQNKAMHRPPIHSAHLQIRKNKKWIRPHHSASLIKSTPKNQKPKKSKTLSSQKMKMKRRIVRAVTKHRLNRPKLRTLQHQSKKHPSRNRRVNLRRKNNNPRAKSRKSRKWITAKLNLLLSKKKLLPINKSQPKM